MIYLLVYSRKTNINKKLSLSGIVLQNVNRIKE